MQIIPGFVLKKRCNKQMILADQISSMPDDILISILSLLPLKEAGRTSVLSRRWRYLWAFTRNLSFDEPELRLSIDCHSFKKSLTMKRTRFVHWVNQVLKLYKSQTLDEFRICFDMDKQSLVDAWISFALERGVKRLELDLLDCLLFGLAARYTFTTHFLRNYNLDCLMVLRLNCVDLTEEVIMHIFSSCPFLELLSLSVVKSLEHLRIPGSSLKLKCLEIVSCYNLKDIEISAINLVSFIYSGPIITLSVPKFPFLAEVSFGGFFAESLFENFPLRSHLFSQLQSLSLDLDLDLEISRFPKLPKFRIMRRLELMVCASHLNSLLHFMAFLKACPVLHRFALKITDFKDIRGLMATAAWKKKSLKGKQRHKCLKVLELVGFIGCKVDVEVAQYVLENTRSLKKIIIDPSSPYEHIYRTDKIRKPVSKQVARERAKQLEVILPFGVELVIL